VATSSPATVTAACPFGDHVALERFGALRADDVAWLEGDRVRGHGERVQLVGRAAAEELDSSKQLDDPRDLVVGRAPSNQARVCGS